MSNLKTFATQDGKKSSQQDYADEWTCIIIPSHTFAALIKMKQNEKYMSLSSHFLKHPKVVSFILIRSEFIESLIPLFGILVIMSRGYKI